MRHTRHSEAGTDDPGCIYCHPRGIMRCGHPVEWDDDDLGCRGCVQQEREAARGDAVQYSVTDDLGHNITARLVAEYGSVQAWLDQGKAMRGALSAAVESYRIATGAPLPERAPGETLRRTEALCACKGGAAVCFDVEATGGPMSCPRGSLLHSATFLPTLDEVRAQRRKAGQ